MNPVSILIPGEPHAQGRQRYRVMHVASGRAIARGYQPAESRNWKATAQAHMRAAFPGAPITGPVKLYVECRFTCPRSRWRKRVPRRVAWHTSRPDGDNCLKAVADAAKGVLWIDDAQVCDARVVKLVAAQGAAPCVKVYVEALTIDGASGAGW